MRSKAIVVSVFMMLAWAAVAEPVAYVSIVRDHSGKVTEKTVGTLDAKVSNPAFRTAAVGCLFAQLQVDNVLDPNARVAVLV